MEGHVRRVALLAVAFGVLLPFHLRAQVAGRWKVTLDNNHGGIVAGELILGNQSAAIAGRLLLENRDSAWMPLRGPRVDAQGGVAFSVAAGELLQFEGRLAGNELEGLVTVQGERRYQWRGIRLQAAEEYYAAMPRFRQLQVRIESARPDVVLPGRWLAAATSLGETVAAVRTGYTELSLRAGLTPLPPDSLARFGLLRVMGLFQREELIRATTATLERIRSNLRGDTAVARFDYLFRPNGRWQVDVHDVALARARRPFPTLTWESARAALASAGLLEREQAGVETIPLALYRLYVQSRNDTAAYQATRQLLRHDPSGAAVTSLVNSYEEASEWYVQATRFLLEQRWIPAGSTFRSPADLVREMWNQAATIPEIRSRPFGYPEGAVRIGTDSSLIGVLIKPENASARDWLARHGWESLLVAAHRLSLPSSERTRLKVGGDLFRLSSIREYARESFSGFLEPRDLILLDPSYQPLFALGTLIHEWQHILGERARHGDRQTGAYRLTADQLIFTQLDPYLAEGFAEWLTEVLLASALTEFPLVGLGEAEKRISLPQNDPHQLGYLLARTLAQTLGDVQATRALLIHAGPDPERVIRDSRVRRAWAAYNAPDRTIARRSEPTLLPMAVFTIEDGEPDLVQSQIIAPYIPRR
jgi:hypothetical protein